MWFQLFMSGFISLGLSGDLLEGERTRIHYGDLGCWNDPSAEAGYQVRFVDDWVEVSYAGAPYFLFAIAYEQGGETIHRYIVSSLAPEASSPGSPPPSEWEETGDIVLEDADYSATGEWATAHLVHKDGDLRIDRIETWEMDSLVIHVQLNFSNLGDEPLTNLMFLYAFESDPENNSAADHMDQSSNDVKDLDGDGLNDWVESAGITLGYSTGIGVCQEDGVDLGHFGEWGGVRHADVTLLDENGEAKDWAMGLRTFFDGDLLPGDSYETDFLVVAGTTPEDTRTNYLDHMNLCEQGEDTSTHHQDDNLGFIDSDDEGCQGCAGYPHSTVIPIWLGLIGLSRRKRA